MGLVTEAEIRTRGQRVVAQHAAAVRSFSVNPPTKTAGAILREQWTAEMYRAAKPYTVFLSHAFSDQILILGVRSYLEDFGHSVYVDWIDDKELDRASVTKATAARLRSRMDNSVCLLFATTNNSSGSKWMPWELGYFDGKKRRAGIFPLAQGLAAGNVYVGQEYLGLYPYLVRTPGTPRDSLAMHTAADKSVPFSLWLAGHNPPA